MHVTTRLWWWLIPLLLLTAWMGARGLDADVIWGDEYHSINDAGGAIFGPRSLDAIWRDVGERNPWHTPGYFFLLKGWGMLVGWEAAALRALSLLSGLLGVAWTYRLGRDFVSPRAGLFAAVILGTSAAFVYYLHEIRMYVLFVPLTAFEVWVYLRIVTAKRKPGALAWLALFGGALAMLYVHYFAILPLMAIVIYHVYLGVRLLFQRSQKTAPYSALSTQHRGALPSEPAEQARRISLCAPTSPQSSSLIAHRSSLTARSWWGVVIAIAAAGALFLPWVGYLLRVASRITEPDEVRAGTLTALQTAGSLAALFANGAPVVLLVTLAAALWQPGRGARRIIILTVLTFGFGLVVNAALQVLYYDARLRYLLALWALLALVMGAGIGWLWGWRRAAALALLALWVVTGVLNGVLWKRMSNYFEGSDLSYPMQWVARDLQGVAQPGDVVMNYLPDDMPAWRYGGVSDYYLFSRGWDFRTLERKWDAAEQEAQHAQILQSLDDDLRVWLAYPTERQPEGLDEFEAGLDETFNACQRVTDRRYGLQMDLYARYNVCCASHNAPLIDYGNGIALSDVEPLPAQVGDTLPVVLAWRVAADVPPNTYSVGLHVTDADGNLAAQQDYGLGYQAFLCERKEIPLANLAPGAYRLRLIVYAWETGARLTGAVTATGEQGEALTLGTFEKEGTIR